MKAILKFLVFFLSTFLYLSCNKNHGLPPSATTSGATLVTMTSATLNGEVNPNGTSTTVIFEFGTTKSYGSVANASQSPTLGSVPVKVSADLTGLKSGTTYHYRVIAENSGGKDFGRDMVTVLYSSTVTDIDGNDYGVISFNSQQWMAENLKTTKYSDGTEITLINSDDAWTSITETSKAYCWYNDDIGNKETYGALYTWAAAMNGAESSNLWPSGVQGVCPTGWHLPSDAEWRTLTTYLGDENVAGGKLKEAGTEHWLSPNKGATNSSGFTALPAGGRLFGSEGKSYNVNTFTSWWTSSESERNPGEAIQKTVSYIVDYVYYPWQFMDKKNGISVRCIKDFD